MMPMPTTRELEELVFHIISTQHGWCGAGGRSLLDVAKLASQHGDHVEIGSLFGATARMAASVKMQFGYTGNVYCIDPMEFDRHEACVRIEGTDSQRLMLREQFQIFSDVTKKFGDRIQLIRRPSHPWPIEEDRKFVTAFIDGWHYGDGPINDAKKLADFLRGEVFHPASWPTRKFYLSRVQTGNPEHCSAEFEKQLQHS